MSWFIPVLSYRVSCCALPPHRKHTSCPARRPRLLWLSVINHLNLQCYYPLHIFVSHTQHNTTINHRDAGMTTGQRGCAREGGKPNRTGTRWWWWWCRFVVTIQSTESNRLSFGEGRHTTQAMTRRNVRYAPPISPSLAGTLCVYVQSNCQQSMTRKSKQRVCPCWKLKA